MKSERLLPGIDEDSLPFWEGALRGELCVQKCAETGRLIFPPRPMSPWAPHRAPIWTKLSGRGSIWSWVVPHPPLLPYFAERAPYNVIVVALDEDSTIRLVGNLVATPGGSIQELDPAGIEIGAAVRVVFEPVSAELTLPQWCLAEASSS